MTDGHFRHLPVVDIEDHVIAMLSIRDIPSEHQITYHQSKVARAHPARWQLPALSHRSAAWFALEHQVAISGYAAKLRNNTIRFGASIGRTMSPSGTSRPFAALHRQ